MFAASPLPHAAPTLSDAIRPVPVPRSPLLAAIAGLGGHLRALTTFAPIPVAAPAATAGGRQNDYERRAARWDGSPYNEIRNRCGVWE